MSELFVWLSDAHTSLQKGAQIALVLFFVTFSGIIIYVFTGKRRNQRFDSYRYIPLDDEDDLASGKPAGSNERKGSADDGQQ